MTVGRVAERADIVIPVATGTDLFPVYCSQISMIQGVMGSLFGGFLCVWTFLTNKHLVEIHTIIGYF